MAQPLPIAGWYPDPEVYGHDRWWDGVGWADNRRVSSTTAPAQTPAYVPTPVVRNNLPLVGFILSLSGLVLPLVVNSLAGGIVSAIGLRRSKRLPGAGILVSGRGLSIAGILIGFIWGGICVLTVVAFIAFELWIIGISTNVQFSDSPVI